MARRPQMLHRFDRTVDRLMRQPDAPVEVAQHGVSADRLQIADVVGIADQPAGRVAAVGEELLEAEGDLAVAAGDEDVHEG